jgi:cysteine-rich repeat protein
VLCVAASGCVSSQSQTCSDGRTCPADSICDVDHHRCNAQDELDACAGKGDGATCDVLPSYVGHCDLGVCLPCGDAVTTAGEVCDDGNLTDRDGCAADCQSNEQCGNGYVDAFLGETCDDENHLDHDGCSSSCITEAPTWTRLTKTPGIRQSFGAAFDARRQRVVAFGGFVPGMFLTDVWEWNGIWSTVRTPVLNGRNANVAVYDARRERVFIHGGLRLDGEITTDTFEWDGVGWVAGPAGPPLFDHCVAYDAKRGVTVVFGGVAKNSIFEDETWELESSTQVWSKRSTATTPGPRAGCAMAYDPSRGVVVMYGGTPAANVWLDELWEYDGTDWRSVSGADPGKLAYASMAFEPAMQRVVLAGGLQPNGVGGTQTTGQSWSWDGVMWRTLGSISQRARHQLVATDRGLLAIGGGGIGTSGPFAQDVWQLDGTTWRLVGLPSTRMAAAVARDDRRNRVFVVGGAQNAGASNETWHLSREMSRIVLVSTNVDEPGANAHGMAGYDPMRDQLVFTGGGGTTAPTETRTWLWNNGWQLTAATLAPARSDSALAWDPVGETLLLFGGYSATATFDETYRWTGAQWTLVDVPQKPPGRANAAVGTDPIRKQIVMFGGATSSPDTSTWIWNGTAWEGRDVSPHPSTVPSFSRKLVWNPARGRLVLLNGPSQTAPAEAWEWDGSAWTQVITLDPPALYTDPIAFTAFDGSGVVVASRNDEMFQLRWQAAGFDETCGANDLDRDALTRCEDDDCWYVCAPLCPPGTSCPASAPQCGNATCDPTESCRSCPADCTCTPACGDFICDPGETCPGDCP